jgi:hypothetical protein
MTPIVHQHPKSREQKRSAVAAAKKYGEALWVRSLFCEVVMQAKMAGLYADKQ